MQSYLIACSMLENELKPYLPEDLSVFWLDRGLHERPKKLHEQLQATIDAVPTEVDTILLGFGFCGSALDGIHCDHAELVLPLFDDCIGMLLTKERNPRTMYFTGAWMEDAQFLGNAYARDVEAMGEEEANEVYEMMLSSYQSLTLLDTGAFDVPQARLTLESFANVVDLSVREEVGDTRLLHQLLHNPTGPQFWTLPRGTAFSLLEFLEKKRQCAALV